MNNSQLEPDDATLSRIGERLAGWRLARNLTQGQVAEQAGVGLRTIQRLESGSTATHLSGFLRVARVLGLLDRVDALVPEPAPSPIAQLKLQGKQRQRASRARKKRGADAWTWDDNK
ncbi:MAG TPA: helix-turn-helix transcriptional regulator [Gemmatimonadaceae bacterium]|nr:helix-turn-helix transcriptional regulator [Gemmatimonadaceae bacterium]